MQTENAPAFLLAGEACDPAPECCAAVAPPTPFYPEPGIDYRREEPECRRPECMTPCWHIEGDWLCSVCHVHAQHRNMQRVFDAYTHHRSLVLYYQAFIRYLEWFMNSDRFIWNSAIRWFASVPKPLWASFRGNLQ